MALSLLSPSLPASASEYDDGDHDRRRRVVAVAVASSSSSSASASICFWTRLLVVLLHFLHRHYCWVDSFSPLCRTQRVTWTSTTKTLPSRRMSTTTTTTTTPTINEDDAMDVEQAIRAGQDQLAKYFIFPLDDWQLQAGGNILNGYNVIVCSPTGSGKVRL